MIIKIESGKDYYFWTVSAVIMFLILPCLYYLGFHDNNSLMIGLTLHLLVYPIYMGMAGYYAGNSWNWPFIVPVLTSLAFLADEYLFFCRVMLVSFWFPVTVSVVAMLCTIAGYTLKNRKEKTTK